MEWLNYHHLLYFYTVAKQGSVARAAVSLRLAQPTLSGQIRKLEEALGEKLFERRGRNLVLTEVGRVAYRYADEIFSLGREFTDTIRGRASHRVPRLVIGIADVVPKLVTRRLLAASQLGPNDVRWVLHEGKPHDLLKALAAHEVDLVISDTPLPPDLSVRAFNHLLGESGVSFFGTRTLASRYRSRFPASLDGAPVLLPTENTVLRRSLDQWFHEIEVHPQIVAEIEDSALLKAFGEHGAGLFAAPAIVAKDVVRQYGVQRVGEADRVVERFYAITVQRRITQSAVAAITSAARDFLYR